MEVGDIRFYVDRWKAVEEIERQELRALTPRRKTHYSFQNEPQRSQKGRIFSGAGILEAGLKKRNRISE